MSSVQFSALNDDCVDSVLRYLPSHQLFACYASSHLKNHQIHRCSVSVLQKLHNPFCAKFKELPHFPEYPCFELRDRENATVVESKDAALFKLSPLIDSVEKIDISLNQNDFEKNKLTQLVELVEPLTNINSFRLSVLNDGKRRQKTSIYVIFRHFSTAFRALLPEIESFGVVAQNILPNDHVEMLREMTSLRSLEIPVALLAPLVSKLPDHLAHLQELSLAVPKSDEENRLVADLVWLLGCVEETAIFSKVAPSFPREFGLAKAIVLKAPRLRTLDAAFKRYRISLAHHVPSVPLAEARCPRMPDLHLCCDDANEIERFLMLFFRGVPEVRCLCISISRYGSTFGFADLMLYSNYPNVNSKLQKLVINGGNVCQTLLNSSELQTFVERLNNTPVLEHLEMTDFAFNFSGFLCDPSPQPVVDFASLMAALECKHSILSLKLCALIDSSSAFRSALPNYCRIFHLIEKPRLCPQGVFVLEPHKYWRPSRLLIVGTKDATANLVDKFYLEIIVPDLFF